MQIKLVSDCYIHARFYAFLCVTAGFFFCNSGAHAAKCEISPLDLNFGVVSTTEALSGGSVRVNCLPESTEKTNFTVCLTLDSNESDYSRRHLRNMNSTVEYDLFFDPQRSNRIDSSSSAQSLYCKQLSTSNNVQKNETFDVYGKFYGGQQPNAGAYSSYNLNLKLLYKSSNQLTFPHPDEVKTSGQVATNFASIQANFENSCVLVGATDINFGHYSDLNVDRFSTGNIGLKCPNNTSWKVSLSNGKYALGNQRRMSNGKDYINYDIYSDSSYSKKWGNQMVNNMVEGKGTSNTQNLTVYAKVPKQKFNGFGNFEDTVNVMITY